MLWDLVQQLQIEGLQRRAVLSDSSNEMHRAAGRTRDEDLADDLARLALVAEAMWALLRERLGVTDDDLRAKLREIDLADGVADGKSTKRPRPCPSCQAMVPPDRETCQFCGAGAGTGSTFG